MPAVFLTALAACHAKTPASTTAIGRNTAATAAKVPTYADELAQLDAQIAEARRLAALRPEDLPVPQEAVSLWLERARLSGDYADYFAAGKAIEEVARRGGALQYPCVPVARLNYIMHRLRQALAELQRCPPTADADDVAAVHADIAFYSGRYAEAETVYRRQLNANPLVSNYVRLALFRSVTGGPVEAAALFEAAELRDHSGAPQLHAWLKLQRGIIALNQGRFDEALALYRYAEEALPGWWLVDDHIAQVRALQGNTDAALALYADIERRTAFPEHMDALARMLRQGPEPASAKAWIERAEQSYRQRLQQYPEATYGHALEHYLWFGRPDQALELAQRNVALRPNGEARMLLAEALFKAGRAADAQREVQSVLESGWDTAEVHAIAAQIAAALGQREEANRQRNIALDLNPVAFRMYPLPQPAQPEALP